MSATSSLRSKPVALSKASTPRGDYEVLSSDDVQPPVSESLRVVAAPVDARLPGYRTSLRKDENK